MARSHSPSGSPGAGPGAEGIARRLLERDCLIDCRPEAGIRISPHFYNTADECDDLIAEIASLAAGRPGLRSTRH